jgi:hypothetical protein
MVRVSVEVCGGAARFKVGVQAPSIQRAVGLVRGLHSASDVGVAFPIDPEGFVVEDFLAEEGLNEGGKTREELAA